LLTKAGDGDESESDYVRRLEDCGEMSRWAVPVKLSDRLHNIRSMKYLRRDRPVSEGRYARVTRELYVPLAERRCTYAAEALRMALDALVGVGGN